MLFSLLFKKKKFFVYSFPYIFTEKCWYDEVYTVDCHKPQKQEILHVQSTILPCTTCTWHIQLNFKHLPLSIIMGKKGENKFSHLWQFLHQEVSPASECLITAFILPSCLEPPSLYSGDMQHYCQHLSSS